MTSGTGNFCCHSNLIGFDTGQPWDATSEIEFEHRTKQAKLYPGGITSTRRDQLEGPYGCTLKRPQRRAKLRLLPSGAQPSHDEGNVVPEKVKGTMNA